MEFETLPLIIREEGKMSKKINRIIDNSILSIGIPIFKGMFQLGKTVLLDKKITFRTTI
jgi:hypothetical protein